MFLRSDLTKDQLRIVDCPLDRDLYVEAPAGHGKTTTAMLKAARLAQTLAGSPRRKVLVLTFSKMAVRQIDYEKQRHVPKPLHSKVLVKTYHSFYFDLIRHYARYLGFNQTDLGLLTAGERETLYLLFSVSHPGLEYPIFSSAQYLTAGICPPAPIAGAQPTELVAAAASFLKDYHKQQNRLGFQDFPYYAYRVLADSTFACDLLAYQYPVVFLDEFQNTNNLQWAILKCFASNTSLVAFADPNQTIHRFRGAGRAIKRFKEERDPHTIPLKTNFRNSSSLYAFARGIAAGTFDTPPPPNVSFRRLSIYKRDKWDLKFDILKAFSSKIRSIGVLTKTNRHVAELSDLLKRKTPRTPTISHEVVSEDFSVQDRENAVLSLFQLVATCNLRHVVGVGSTVSACSTGNANYLFYLNQAVEKGQCAPEAIVNEKGIGGSRNTRTVLRVIGPFLEAGVPDNAEEAWQRTERVLQGLEQIRSIPDLSAAYKNLRDEWAALAARQGTPTLEDYSSYVMAQRRRRSFLEQRSYLRGVFVMTLHQSQGKQFDAVFIWRCNDQIIPHPEEIRKGDTSPSQHLLYTGITRARHIVRIYHEEHQYAKPSRLITPFLRAQ